MQLASLGLSPSRPAPTVSEIDAALELCVIEPSDLDVARRRQAESSGSKGKDGSRTDLASGPAATPAEAALRLESFGGASPEMDSLVKSAIAARQQVFKAKARRRGVVEHVEARLRMRAAELRTVSGDRLTVLDCYRVAAAEQEARSAESRGNHHWLQRAVRRDEETR